MYDVGCATGVAFIKAGARAPVPRGGDARRILAERYARGEIETQEYEERLRRLDACD